MIDLKNRGWVRLHRKIEENPLWFLEPFTKAQAWVDLFLNSNHKDGFINIRGNIINIKRGQIGWSELTMTKRWKWSKNKVRRFLKWLEMEQQIEQQKSALTTIITIINYEQYQQDDTTDETTKRQQKDSRRYTNNNDNNDNNDKEVITSEETSQINEVFNIFYNTINRNINFGNKTQRKAVEDMIRLQGFEKVKKVAEFACQFHGEPYMPVITTPLQLKDKWSALESWAKTKQQKDNSKGLKIGSISN